MINLIFRTVTFFSLLSFLSACVSAGTHKKLQRAYDASQNHLVKCTTDLATDQKQIQDLQSKLKDEDLIIKNLEAKLGKTASAKHKLEGNVAEMKSALAALKKEKAETEKRIQEFRDLTAKFKSLIDTGKLTVKMVDGQMVVGMSSDVLFASGSARLSTDGKAAIEEVTSLLQSVPHRRFQIEGFTDNMPIKTALFPSNWELASARALTVLKTMLDAGMPADRVDAASFGETHPIQSNDTADGRAANRRIEIVIVPDLSTLPGYDQLQKMSAGN